jgi:hypothetical protein
MHAYYMHHLYILKCVQMIDDQITELTCLAQTSSNVVPWTLSPAHLTLSD